MFLKNGNQSRCRGKEIYIQINGFKKGSGNEKVTCVIGKIDSVKKGQKVEWNSDNQSLGNCSNVVFDDSVGKEPTVQVKTDKGLKYCPKSVELKINDIYFCGIMKSDNNKGKYKQEQNSKIHSTIRGRCK